ncbi:DUF4881 domain-containing protein [Desulfovibrio sp. ZJ369]|uniref:DUF4881 domain-containing protein n=1 Tax=Desulfovibrio sp. ZJ369 TaxID=2709793 RepID=UPI0013EBCB3A|nr:DUF4881 domain-containing protein [Desulfovibrio sp. ZJ369]
MKIRILLSLALALSFALLTACDFDGGVEQGRCVAFDPTARTLTIVVDVNHDQFNPHYSGGVHTFKLPPEARDMGPLPDVGGRLMINLAKSEVLIYDPSAKSVEVVPVEFTDVEKNIKKNHPKVAGKTFPVIDREQSTVTVYSTRLNALVTFRVPADLLDLPPYSWTAGNEMRIAYRNEDKSQAMRIMNVTKTDIFKK